MKNYKFNIIVIFSAVLLIAISAQAQTAESPSMSGGSFTMTQSVIAGGGGKMQRVAINVDGIIGQPLAGLYSSRNQYEHYSGFWLPAQITQHNSAVAGGRIVNSEGNGIRNAQVTITFPNGEIRTTTSGAGGYYRFADIPLGKNYVVTVTAKRFTFSQNAQERKIVGDTQDINFVAEANGSTKPEEKPR
jgi:hypothetical protein